MGEHVVADVDAIPDGGSIVVELEGRAIGVFKVRGEVFALRNRCPHQGGPVCTGAVVPTLTARVEPSGAVTEFFDESRMVVACPWHGWEFDLRNGRCVADRSRGIATYEAEVRDGQVIVHTRTRASSSAPVPAA
jgi:nitrite reductase/ring-hydroxylating ferredoxin subunit